MSPVEVLRFMVAWGRHAGAVGSSTVPRVPMSAQLGDQWHKLDQLHGGEPHSSLPLLQSVEMQLPLGCAALWGMFIQDSLTWYHDAAASGTCWRGCLYKYSPPAGSGVKSFMGLVGWGPLTWC